MAASEPLVRVYAALLLGYTIHFIYCIWGNLRNASKGLAQPEGRAGDPDTCWREL